MIRRIVKQYTPTWRALDTPIEQAKAIQDLYDQVRLFYDYLNSPEFNKEHIGPPGLPGPPGPPGDKGDPGMSSFEFWMTAMVIPNTSNSIDRVTKSVLFSCFGFRWTEGAVVLLQQ